ncbi:sulfate reduction electron transfer complex DsrMKJOP subunit DsrO [Elusimicrobiota bacterium]
MIDRKGFLQLIGATAAAGLAAKVDAFAALGGKGAAHASKGHSKRTPTTSGNRWAMAIDLGKCVREKGCTRCMEACHATHNVPELPDAKHEVKWLWKEKFKYAFHEQDPELVPEKFQKGPVPLLCNHCDSPACTKVCPTQATWKRKSDGVVMMDWHRCIGCRYCIAACPYGSRSFNYRDPRPFLKKIHEKFPTRTKGVVEKCTFCEERLAKGKRPACVEACPAKALVFGDIEDPKSSVRKVLKRKFSVRRKPALGTGPQVYYLVT